MTRIRNHPMAALGVLVLGLFMTLLDLTIVNIAVPSILDGLHASLDQVLWVLNAYSLLYAVLLITSARLGDIYGPRNLFAVGVVIFTIASGFSALAQDPTQLILSRGLQGLGAALLAPQGLPLMMSLFPVEKRGGVFAIYGVIAGLAVIADEAHSSQTGEAAAKLKWVEEPGVHAERQGGHVVLERGWGKRGVEQCREDQAK